MLLLVSLNTLQKETEHCSRLDPETSGVTESVGLLRILFF